MTMTELAASYRREADALRHRMRLVREKPARTEAEQITKEERLRLLKAMRRDVREVAAFCEHYYDKAYHGSQYFRV